MGDQLDPQVLVRWQQTLDILRSKNISRRDRAFLQQAQPQAQMANVLLIAVPSEYARDILQGSLNVQLKEALEIAFGPGTSEAIVIDMSLNEQVANDYSSAASLSPSTEEKPFSHTPSVESPAGFSALTQGSTPADPSAVGAPSRSSSPSPAMPTPPARRRETPSLHELEVERGQSSPSFAQDPNVSSEFSEDQQHFVEPPLGDSERTQWESTARLNPKYSFDTFVIGQSNRFAHAAAFAVSENPAAAYNPLFIYGGSGLGKTHLLHAIGHYAKHLYPDLRVRYVNSEEFTNDFINSIRDDEGSSFKQIYRNVDMLLIDDIQFLADKERTQEEFFHTFNTLHNHQKQVVITSDMPPKMLTGFAERMLSRFEWGLITDVQPPELETRIAILRKKAQNESLDVPDDVMEYIASNITSNIRELEGALIRVTAFASLNQQRVDRPLAELVLKDLITDDGAQEITASQVLTATAQYFDVSIEELQSKSRNRTLVTARQIAMYLLRELTDMSLPKIGQEFGGRDHTTVMHADRKIRELMAERRQIFNQVTELTNKIKQEQRTQK